MKFQSVIALIMHGGRSLARAALVFCVLAQVSCVALKADKHTYAASSPAAEVNGATIRMQVRPEGTEGASVALSAMVVSAMMTTFDGPFRWRIEAVGREGEHESLELHGIRTQTSKTRRNERYPAEWLGRSEEFRAKGDGSGACCARYEIPGMLEVKPREDGALEVTVDLTVRAKSGSQRSQVTFRMDPAEEDADEFVFLPVEVAENLGKPLSEQDEKGWD